jgi:hypothetical protein
MGVSMRRARVVQQGAISVALLATSQVVTFATPMPTPYDLYFRTTGGLTITDVPSQTANGFTLSLGVTLAGTLNWVAVEQIS